MVENRIIYLCDKKKQCHQGYACREGLCNHTTDEDHAKHGAIRVPSEAFGRFDEVLTDEKVVYYVEREDDR